MQPVIPTILSYGVLPFLQFWEAILIVLESTGLLHGPTVMGELSSKKGGANGHLLNSPSNAWVLTAGNLSGKLRLPGLTSERLTTTPVLIKHYIVLYSSSISLDGMSSK